MKQDTPTLKLAMSRSKKFRKIRTRPKNLLKNSSQETITKTRHKNSSQEKEQ